MKKIIISIVVMLLSLNISLASTAYDIFCDDGTPYLECKVGDQPWYCEILCTGSNGVSCAPKLVENCLECGCPTGYTCETTLSYPTEGHVCVESVECNTDEDCPDAPCDKYPCPYYRCENQTCVYYQPHECEVDDDCSINEYGCPGECINYQCDYSDWIDIDGNPIVCSECSQDEDCMAEHQVCYAECVEEGIYRKCEIINYRPPKPCPEAEWNGYPTCEFDTTKCEQREFWMYVIVVLIIVVVAVVFFLANRYGVLK